VNEPIEPQFIARLPADLAEYLRSDVDGEPLWLARSAAGVQLEISARMLAELGRIADAVERIADAANMADTERPPSMISVGGENAFNAFSPDRLEELIRRCKESPRD
jgi:hypothetical protein